MNLKIYIETYGCQMNVNDSQVAVAILEKAGCSVTEDISQADVILVNTCSVRDNAEKRVLGRLEVFRLEKKKREGVIVGVLGCMAQRLKDELLKNGNVDFTIGPDSYRSLPAVISYIRDKGGKMTETNLSSTETYSDIDPVRVDSNGVSAFISIMRGCNNVCSYCVVPYTRGAERSRDPETILAEARDVFAKGYKEVTLLGQNVDSYLWKSGESEVDFPDLLDAVAGIDPSLRVRFATNHPKDISDKLIETMASRKNICDHIHLPVQSGSDRMLEKMRRRYTREWYMERVRKIREVLPGCGITTDVIAGFCSETEEDHQATLSLFKEAAFDYAFMFCYSERPGTIAARNYPDDVPADVKTRRLNEIIELQNRLSLESNQADVGKTFEVLVEGPSKRNPQDLCGRTGSDKMCVFPGEGHKAGDYVNVKIESCTSATLLGTITE